MWLGVVLCGGVCVPGYEGQSCAVCSKGYFRQGESCAKCQGFPVFYFVMALLVYGAYPPSPLSLLWTALARLCRPLLLGALCAVLSLSLSVVLCAQWLWQCCAVVVLVRCPCSLCVC